MSRLKLSEALLPALLDDFAERGAAAIERVRETDPAGYLRLVASVIPKHVAIDDGSDLDMLSDEELEARIRDLNEQIAVARAGEVKG